MFECVGASTNSSTVNESVKLDFKVLLTAQGHLRTSKQCHNSIDSSPDYLLLCKTVPKATSTNEFLIYNIGNPTAGQKGGLLFTPQTSNREINNTRVLFS